MKTKPLAPGSGYPPLLLSALRNVALMAALWLASLPAQGAASLAVSPTRIWLGDSVTVTVGALGWYDSLTDQVRQSPSILGSGFWVFPPVGTDDPQTFNNPWASSNIWTFSYTPPAAGTYTITATNVASATIEVVALESISYSPNPIAVGSNVTFTVNLNPAAATPPGALQWPTNFTGTGTTASQTWTNWGNYTVEVRPATGNGSGTCASVPVFAVVGGNADSAGLCCGTNGGTNIFHASVQPYDPDNTVSNLVFWTGGLLVGTNTGTDMSITFTNPGVSVVTATLGSSSFTFTNTLYRVEIDPLLKTNYFSYGSNSTVTLTLSSNSYGNVIWTVPGLNTDDNPTNAPNTVTVLTEMAPAGEYTAIATSAETGACVDTAKIFIVDVSYNPPSGCLPIGCTASWGVTVNPSSVESLVIFTNATTNLTISGSAPSLTVVGGMTPGLEGITASINGVSLVSTGQVVVFKATFVNGPVAIPEGAGGVWDVAITPTNAIVQLPNLAYSSSDTNVTEVSTAPNGCTLVGKKSGTNEIYLTFPPFTNRLDTGAVTVVKLTVDSVTFVGSARSPILDDLTGVAYPEPNWVSGRATNYPTLLQNSFGLKANVTFKVEPASYKGGLIVGAVGAFPIPFETKTPDASNAVVTWNGAVSMTMNKLGKTNYYGPYLGVDHRTFPIEWQFTTPNLPSNRFSAGTSTNEAYVALANVSKRHTIVHLACHYGNATNPENAARDTWDNAGFTACGVTTWDYQFLYYYKSGIVGAGSVYTANDLIQQRNGNAAHGLTY